MTENPYAPPKAAVTPVESISTQEAPFFAVSVPKLLVLSLFSFGLYELYWFYRNWALIKTRDRSGLSPFWRAFFALFFCYQCFAVIRDYGVNKGITKPYPVGLLAAAWILLSLALRLPEPYQFFGFLRILALLPVQALANTINRAEAPEAPRNARLTPWNWAYLAAFLVAIVVLATYGAAPDQTG